MLLGFSDGRFGNQLFQLAALLTAQKDNELVFAFGFGDLPDFYTSPRLVKIEGIWPWRKERAKTFPRLGFLFRQLAANRVLSEVAIDRREKSFKRRKAVFPRIALFTNRYLQVGDLAQTGPIARLQANAYKEIFGQKLENSDPFVFVHIRRGDYLTFPSESESASLPDAYYRGGLKVLLEKHPGVRVVLFTDDPDWAISHEFFSRFEVCTKTALESWVLMSTAIGGVLSASSYSYWAAKVAQYGLEAENRGLFVAPKYWLGWRYESWTPRDIASETFTYIDVRETIVSFGESS